MCRSVRVAALIWRRSVRMFGAPTSSADRQVCRGEPRTLCEVGEFLALARGRIRQVECKALAKLRCPAFNSALPQLLLD
jgi:hypothetical protein